MARSRYHYPGEYTYKGILYQRELPIDVLKEVEESLTLTSNHVVIASYPKSGYSLLKIQYRDCIWVDSQFEAKASFHVCVSDLIQVWGYHNNIRGMKVW